MYHLSHRDLVHHTNGKDDEEVAMDVAWRYKEFCREVAARASSLLTPNPLLSTRFVYVQWALADDHRGGVMFHVDRAFDVHDALELVDMSVGHRKDCGVDMVAHIHDVRFVPVPIKRAGGHVPLCAVIRVGEGHESFDMCDAWRTFLNCQAMPTIAKL